MTIAKPFQRGDVEWGNETFERSTRARGLRRHTHRHDGRLLTRSRARSTCWLPAIAAVILVVLTVDVVRDDGIVAADHAVNNWVVGHQIHWLRLAGDWLTDVLSPPVDIAVFLIYALRSRRVRFRSGLWVVAALSVAVVGMKSAVGRPTPLHPSRFYGDFPSGHTASLLVCAGAAILLTRGLSARMIARLWLATGVATAVVIATLLYIQAHWLSDTLASLAIATIILWAVAVTRPANDPRSPS